MANRICPFPECGKPHHAHGYCAGHARQFKLGQELRPLRRSALTQTQRFWEKVQKTETCWTWTGARNHLGYGQIWVSDEKRVVMAHIFSVWMSGRLIPDGWDVDHLCRNPPCVNPDHLEPVPHAENMRRAPWTAVQFQASKTHCPQGHPYSPENTKMKRNSSGTLSRLCKECRLENQRRRRARKRA